MTATSPNVNKCAVLVIDDSTTARAALTARLREEGYTVLELSSAIGATRAILRSSVSAVIVDISMPGLSGDKLVGVLRKTTSLARLTVVVVSSDAALLADAEQLPGVDAVLLKSRADADLPRVLARAMADRRRASTPGI